MIYDVKISEHALLDMKGMYEHICNELMEPIIAAKQYARIEEAIYSLEQMPERFRRYDKEPWKSRNLRIMLVDNYIVYYIVNNTKNLVTAMRVMYGRRDTEKELENMTEQEY